MQRLRKHVKLKTNQYGAEKGCGTAHMLVEMKTRIAEEAAVATLSIDFSKAFNRMSHQTCISALRRKGAPEDTIKLVERFLRGRQMRIKVETYYSKPRRMPGGAPQGKRSGNFLFAVTIDHIEDADFLEESEQPAPGPQEGRTVPSRLGLTDLWQRLGAGTAAERKSSFTSKCATMPRGPRRAALDSSFLPSEWDGWEIQRELHHNHEEQPPWIGKYIDDFTVIQTLPTWGGIRHITQGREERIVHATQLQETYNRVKFHADKIGMKIHPQKTQLMCSASTNTCKVTAYIEDGEQKIKSCDALKTVGVVFGQRYGEAEQIKHIRKKVAAKLRSLEILKGAGIDQKTLTTVYKMYLRPIIDYGQETYRPAITGLALAGTVPTEMPGDYLRLQTRVPSAPGKSGVTSLEGRRKEMITKFATKAYTTERFGN